MCPVRTSSASRVLTALPCCVLLPSTRDRRTVACRCWVSGRRYVVRGVPGGYLILDNKARRWVGDYYEVQPHELCCELNGKADNEGMTYPNGTEHRNDEVLDRNQRTSFSRRFMRVSQDTRNGARTHIV